MGKSLRAVIFSADLKSRMARGVLPTATDLMEIQEICDQILDDIIDAREHNLEDEELVNQLAELAELKKWVLTQVKK